MKPGNVVLHNIYFFTDISAKGCFCTLFPFFVGCLVLPAVQDLALPGGGAHCLLRYGRQDPRNHQRGRQVRRRRRDGGRGGEVRQVLQVHLPPQLLVLRQLHHV